jgi:acetyl-CoA synthetase (ADP-forming)
MASNGVETIVGTKKDATFGQVVMFGVGGILAELYKDVVIRVCPISEQEAEEMLNEIKGKVILNGFRGMPSVNRAALQTTLLATCSLAEENPEIDSIDLNPVLADEKGAVALDSRIIVA